MSSGVCWHKSQISGIGIQCTMARYRGSRTQCTMTRFWRLGWHLYFCHCKTLVQDLSQIQSKSLNYTRGQPQKSLTLFDLGLILPCWFENCIGKQSKRLKSILARFPNVQCKGGEETSAMIVWSQSNQSRRLPLLAIEDNAQMPEMLLWIWASIWTLIYRIYNKCKQTIPTNWNVV